MTYASPEWVDKPLEELTASQWEQLCDGCGKCCMIKLQDEQTDIVYYTNVACELFNEKTCRCMDYQNRSSRVPDCLTLTLKSTHVFEWLPLTCAYRLRAQSRPLPDWHPLISGNKNSTHESNMSVQNESVSIKAVDNLEYHLVDWR